MRVIARILASARKTHCGGPIGRVIERAASHPDRMTARGLPPECVAPAPARMACSNAAYDRLSGRGLHQPA